MRFNTLLSFRMCYLTNVYLVFDTDGTRLAGRSTRCTPLVSISVHFFICVLRLGFFILYL